MKVDLFDFDLPRELIADCPARPRDSARLLDLTGDRFTDRRVWDLPGILNPGDLLIGNNTRVIPARLIGKRDQAVVEVTLHRNRRADQWAAFARPARKLSKGDQIQFAEDFTAIVVEKYARGEVLLQFNRTGNDLLVDLNRHGKMPLPPYIRRNADMARNDRIDYQTVYAQIDGAVAAPTAGLHFTESLLEKIHHKGIRFITLTLHVGAGTFLPVRVKDTRAHKMHSEWGYISPDVARQINETKAGQGHIVAIGTTVLRLLESAADRTGRILPFTGETDLFITPGYRFKVVDRLLTNFHLPRSTLFMLVCAFAGMEKMKAAYRHAQKEQYRFYSYGDACFLKQGQEPKISSDED